MEEGCQKCIDDPGSGPCPFALEVNEETVECACCDKCRDECAMDI